MNTPKLNYHSVQIIQIDANSAGQRVDNYLVKLLKNVPKSHIYKLLRKGEVRVNSKRIKPTYRLLEEDKLRVPPVKYQEKSKTTTSKHLINLVTSSIHYEDNDLIVINKPSGLAVHSGSGIEHGVIEVLRIARPDAKYLELVHRLDKDTSGLLLLAKKRKTLVAMHQALKENKIKKRYLALVIGAWPKKINQIDKPLLVDNYISGERMVTVHPEGKTSLSTVQIRKKYNDYTLLEMHPITGRTHQLRVHAKSIGHPIVGDVKYGDQSVNKKAKAQGLKHLFLHAGQISFAHPETGEKLLLEAPLSGQQTSFLEIISNE